MANEELRFTISLKDAMSESVKEIRREVEEATTAVDGLATASDSKKFDGFESAVDAAKEVGVAADGSATKTEALAMAGGKAGSAMSTAAEQATEIGTKAEAAVDSAASSVGELPSKFSDAGSKSADAMADPIKTEVPKAAGDAGDKAADAIAEPLEKKVPDAAEKAGSGAGQKFGSAFKKLIGPLLAGITITATVKVGMDAAMQEQQSALVLEGLYGSAEKAADTLQLLKDVAKTSALDFSGYASAAESLAYAGVEGQQAADVLSNVGAAITAAGGDTSNLDRATESILKGVNAGKFQLDTLQQLSDAGVPILSGLADHLGVTIEEVNKMASAGKIGLEDVLAVMEDGSGETFQAMIEASEGATGSLANQWAMAKDEVSVALGEVMLPLIDEIAPKIGPAAEALSNFITGIPGAFEWVEENIIWLSTLTATIAVAGTASWIASGGLAAMGVAIKGVFLAISTGIKSIPVIGWIIAGIGLLVTALVWFFTKTETGKELWDKIWTGIKDAAAFVVDWFQETALPILTGAWEWIKEAADKVVTWFQDTALPILQGVWDGIATGATWLWENVLKPTWDAIQIAFLIVATAIGLYWEFVLKPVFNAIATVATWLWENVLKPSWEGIKAGWNFLVEGIKWAWENVLKPAWNAVEAAAIWLWENVLKPAFDNIKSNWETMASGIEWVWLNIIKPAWDAIVSAGQTMWEKLQPIFDAIKSGIEKVGEGFKLARDVIGDAWDSIQSKARGPAKFVVDTVYNKGIVPVWNRAAGIFNMKDKKLDKVSTNFAVGGHAGRVYGPGTGTSDEVPARLSRGEFVVNARATRENLSLLHAINGHRGHGYKEFTRGYNVGGAVGSDGVVRLAKGGTLIDAANWWVAKGARGSRHPAFGGAVRSGHSKGSMHYQDRAVDLNYGPGGENAIEKAFFDKWVGQFKSLFPGIRVIWRAPGHFNHMHIDTSNGADIGDFSGAGGGGFGFDLSPLTDLLSKVTGFGHDSGLFGDGIKNAGKSLVQAPIDWIKDKLSAVGDFVEGAADAVGTRLVKERVRAVAIPYGWGFGSQWNDLSALIHAESTWNPNAKNPGSNARGLFQKMTSLHGPVEKTVEGQAKWGLNYIKRTYGTPTAAWAFHRRNNYYRDGGLAELAAGGLPDIGTQLFDNGGMWAPGTLGINLSGQHEQVLTGVQSQYLTEGIRELATVGGRGDLQVQVVIEGDVYGMDDFEDKLDEATRKAFAEIVREWEERG